MKRRRVSPFRMGLSIFLLVFFLAGIVAFSWLLTMYHPADAAHPYDWGFVGAMSPIVACTIGLVLALYMAFKGAFSATYTVDAEGMTTYFRKHTYRLLWQDCLEFEIVPVMVNHGTAAWILYCSTKALSKKERDNFSQYHKNDYAHIQFFQLCDEEAYQEFLSCIPERARNYLVAEMLVHGLTWERK